MIRRDRTAYADMGRAPVVVAGAVDVTTPVEGFYRMKLRSGGIYAGVHIWHGPPLDPVTGEELDRSWRWQAAVNAEPIDFERVWPVCAGEPISHAEYRTYIIQQKWAREHAPDSAFADPRKRHDPLTCILPF